MSMMHVVTPRMSSGQIVRIVVVMVFVKMVDQDLVEWHRLSTVEAEIRT